MGRASAARRIKKSGDAGEEEAPPLKLCGDTREEEGAAAITENPREEEGCLILFEPVGSERWTCPPLLRLKI